MPDEIAVPPTPAGIPAQTLNTNATTTISRLAPIGQLPTHLSHPAPNPSFANASENVGTLVQRTKDAVKKFLQVGGQPPNPHTNPSALLAEIRRTVVNTTTMVDQLRHLNRDILGLCNKLGQFASTRKRLPEHGEGKDHLDIHFSTAEDFVFFGALAIITVQIQDRVLAPFHPALSNDKNNEVLVQYSERCHSRKLALYIHAQPEGSYSWTNSELQRDVAEWRSRKFSTIESGCYPEIKDSILKRVLQNIVERIEERLLCLPGELALPDAFREQVFDLISRAYDWNIVVKRDVLDYDLVTLVPWPGSAWDEQCMESFERIDMKSLPSDIPIISPASIGLWAKYARGNKLPPQSHVQGKARVLLIPGLVNRPEEGFLAARGDRADVARTPQASAVDLNTPLPALPEDASAQTPETSVPRSPVVASDSKPWSGGRRGSTSRGPANVN
jgi:hypothetical protein